MLERLDFADSEIRSGELQVWVPNCPFLHVAFIIRRNVKAVMLNISFHQVLLCV